MIDKNVLLFDCTYLDVEETYSIDGVEYLQDLLINRTRVLNFFSKFISKKTLYRIVASMDLIASYAIVTLRMITSLCNCIRSKTPDINPSNLGLLSHDLIIPRSKSAEVFNSIDAWLVLPFTRFDSGEIKNKKLTVYSILSYKDVIYSYILSLQSIGYSNSTNKHRYIRRLYVSYEFFLVKRTLAHLNVNTKLVFANHKDRWAILYDESHQVCKTLLQHGAESTKYNYPIKLKNITELYVFNKTSYDIMMQTILTCRPKMHFLKPTISLTSYQTGAKFTILIVSPISPLKYKEEFIISNLQGKDIEIFVKPHYQNKDYSFYESLSEKYTFTLIKEQIFPRVDVVVSYESTLVIEYQMHNVDVLVYEENTLQDIIQNIISMRDKSYFIS